MSMKNSNDTIGNQTCDLLACSVVPQPIAPLRAPSDNQIIISYFNKIGNIPQFRDLPTQLPSSHMIFHVVFSPMILAMQLNVTSVPSGKLEPDNKNEAYLKEEH